MLVGYLELGPREKVPDENLLKVAHEGQVGEMDSLGMTHVQILISEHHLNIFTIKIERLLSSFLVST